MKPVAIIAVVLGGLIGACGKGSGGTNNNCDTCQGQDTPPLIATFTANPAVLPAGGGNVTLSWTVYGATSLSISNGLGTVTPITTPSTGIIQGSIVQGVTETSTLTLTATNAVGKSTRSVYIAVQ